MDLTRLVGQCGTVILRSLSSPLLGLLMCTTEPSFYVAARDPEFLHLCNWESADYLFRTMMSFFLS